MSKPMFFYAGVYDGVADADADYESIKALHAGKAIGSYDSAIISKGQDGKVTVTKTEKPVKHGTWIGIAAGAGAAVLFPVALPAVIASGAAGGGLGAWIGHLAHGTSRAEAKDVGALLERGKAALVVVGIDHDAEQIEQAATGATNHVLKRNVGDWDEAEQEALEAIEQEEQAA
jgi:uncharacterized membrane protein